MSLRQRILVTFLAITAILVVPAAYGIVALRDLREIARDLQTRDANALLALGRVQGSIKDLELAHATFIVVPEAPQIARVDTLIARSEAQLDALGERPGSSEEYRVAVARAERQLRVLAEAVRGQRVELAGERDTSGTYHHTVVLPAFEAMDQALDPVADAIYAQGRREVGRAQEVSNTAAATTGVALVVAVALAVLLGLLMTQALLRPIQELRRGMSKVAQGDFGTRVRIPPDRPDELGDLARSFSTMTTQLAELDRLKAEVVSVASHEIKTPLSVIRGYVSLLADGIYGAVSDTQRKTLAAISDQVDRLTRLIHRLLDISRLEARRAGAGVEVEVTDTGVGIPADKLPRIFEKFYQVENEAQPRSAGSGLGLAIAREIVEAHGGTITAESEEGKGAVFRVVLPEQPPPPGHSART
jgi:signal transduction histidine kinase